MNECGDNQNTPVPVAQLDTIKPIAVRKKRASKHDFKDGQGRVFAHRHDNGKGWVADTAKVDDSVYVGPRCAVYNFAQVSENVRMEGRAKIYGHGYISGNVIVKHDAQVHGRAVVRDTTQLHNNVQITGNAIVSGTSQLFGNCYISNRSQILHSCLDGSVRISGDVHVVRSNLSGSVLMNNRAIAIHATLHGRINISGYAQILNSTIQCAVINESSIDVTDFAVIADNSLLMIPIEIKNHAVVVRSTFAYNSSFTQENANRLVLNNQILVSQRRFTTHTELASFIQSFDARGNSPYVSVVATPVRAPTQINTSPRRVMRLQEAGT